MTFKLLLASIALCSSITQASNLTTAPSSLAPNSVNAVDVDALDAYSENGYGMTSMSAYGSAGWFGSAFSGNTSPTVVIQSVGHNSSGPDADLLQVQDENGGVLLRIDSAGVLHGSVTSSP